MIPMHNFIQLVYSYKHFIFVSVAFCIKQKDANPCIVNGKSIHKCMSTKLPISIITGS